MLADWGDGLDSYRFDYAYRDGTPLWVIDRPQPVFVQAEEQGLIRGRVLEVGCGTGDLSLYLASQGHGVTGIDFSPSAIETAARKRDLEGLKIDFCIENALNIGDFDRVFDTVVDSAMYHCLSSGNRQKFANALDELLQLGGRYVALVSANRVCIREILERFEDWQLILLTETEFVNRNGNIPAYFFCVEK